MNSKLYFYILTDPDKHNKCKIGITKNPDQRIRAYRTACPQCTFTYLIEIETKRFESEVLFHLKGQFKVDREYVHCNPKIVENIVSGLIEDYSL